MFTIKYMYLKPHIKMPRDAPIPVFAESVEYENLHFSTHWQMETWVEDLDWTCIVVEIPDLI